MSYQNIRILLLTFAVVLTACTEEGPETMVGTLERDRIELKVESNEPIIAIGVTDGEEVEAGTMVLEQDNRRAKAHLAQLTALRDQVDARLAELQRGPREELIRESQARLAASEVITRNAHEDLERTRDIFERGLSNQARLDHVQALWETSVENEKANRESLASLLNGTTVEELQQAQAAVDAAGAAIDSAQIDLDRHQIRTPAKGLIDKVLYEIGERPTPGTTVAVLLDNSRVYARIYVPEHLKSQIKPGSKLNIRLDGIDAGQQGTVSWVSAEAVFTPYFALTEHDRSRLSFLAEVEMENAESIPSGVPLEAWLPGQNPQ